MEKPKKIKLFIALFYLLFISLFFFYLFSKFSLHQLTSYEFIKDNLNYFSELKKTNIILLSLSFLFFTILWVFPFLGFGSPIALLGGFILGKWLGVIIVILGLSIGATFLYIFANYFLKEYVKKNFLDKFQDLEMKFKKSEFIYLLLYRFIGGIPWQISCILPAIFNVKVINFFLASMIGITPQIFLVVSIGSGLEDIINNNLEAPGIKDIITSPNIYTPLIIFIFLVIITIFLRKFFYKK
tara:strand:- start:32 stop:754 length:723 start_codon:yes stop_codon:yes gene_type:complete